MIIDREGESRLLALLREYHKLLREKPRKNHLAILRLRIFVRDAGLGEPEVFFAEK